MKNEDLRIIPYTATSLSVIGRFIFMFLIYKNKSTNSLSLLFCVLSIASSSMWIYYSVQSNDTPMIVRSSTEITLLSISSIYIIRNKIAQYIEDESQRTAINSYELRSPEFPRIPSTSSPEYFTPTDEEVAKKSGERSS
jgi:lipid-A-disaccharide synthase-like uncharacterized protein